MPENRTPSPSRLLAPIALVLCALAFLFVLSVSSVDGDGDKAGGSSAAEDRPTTTSEAPRPRRRRASYTVKVGDSLGAIAEKTGVDVEELQLLNPEVDAQALSPGQKLKLRE